MSTSDPASDVSPIVRNALRICLSAKEYRAIHETAIKRAPPAVQDRLPSPSHYDALVHSKNQNRHGEAAVRASLRVFVGSSIALKLADLIVSRIQGGAAT